MARTTINNIIDVIGREVVESRRDIQKLVVDLENQEKSYEQMGRLDLVPEQARINLQLGRALLRRGAGVEHETC